jgi:hypothetical protein
MIVSVVNDVLSTIDDVCVAFITNIIDGRQCIIYNRHNHIHVKPSTQTPSIVDNTSFTTDTMIVSVVNDVLSTIDDVCVDGFRCI